MLNKYKTYTHVRFLSNKYIYILSLICFATKRNIEDEEYDVRCDEQNILTLIDDLSR